MMSGEAWLYLLAVLINAVNLFLQVFFTIMYSDLEWSVPQVSSGYGDDGNLDAPEYGASKIVAGYECPTTPSHSIHHPRPC
jgi:hypothetical protein